MQPDDIDAALDRANRLLEDGKPAESLRCLDQVEDHVLDSEDRIEWASLRAWALSELGRDEEAVDTLEDALSDHPNAPRLLATLGVVLSNADDLEAARATLEEALSLNPSDEVSVANLALVYEKLRDYERALEYYERALELGADVDWILQRKAATLTEFGRYDEAKSALRRYLSLVPDDAAQWIALGILHSDDDEFDQATQCYRAAEKLEPDSATLRLNWGVTAVRARQLVMARRQLAELERVERRTVRPALLRAFIVEEEGDVRGAQRIYERILSRARLSDEAELAYALEMAMDFFARHKQGERCARLLVRAYAANICTVELCEAYREVAGEFLEKGYWYSLLIEADYRPGLREVRERGEEKLRPRRFIRDYQVVATDRDEAVGYVMDFVRHMGEGHPTIREIIGEETVENTHAGLYEVESESLVFSDEADDAEE